MSQIPTVSVNGVTLLMQFFSLFCFYNKESERQHSDNDNVMHTSMYSLSLCTLAISEMLPFQFKLRKLTSKGLPYA